MASPVSNPKASESTAKTFLNHGELARIFNTAVVSTQAGAPRDFSAEIYSALESSAFKSILSAIRQLAVSQEITERLAAEQVIRTFRKIDGVWSEYIQHEGLNKLRGE